MQNNHLTSEFFEPLQFAYDFFNEKLFGGRLPGAIIVVTRRTHVYGHYVQSMYLRHDGTRTSDEIALNPRYFATRTVVETLSTLVHEACHQWQCQPGEKKPRSGYHDRDFAEKMKHVGLIASATGYPGGKSTGQQMTHYIEEGGPFHRACQELLAGNFGIQWFDRYPAFPPGPPPGAHGCDVSDVDSQHPMPADLPDPMLKPDEYIQAVTNGGEEPTSWGGGVNPNEKNGSRQKFICPSCRDAAWGKPTLLILCGKCKGAKMEPVSKLVPLEPAD